MLVVAGLSLKNLQPRVWDPSSENYISGVRAVMLSYADFHSMAARRKRAMDVGLREFLGVPEGVKVYLDNGSFFFRERKGGTPQNEYVEFVKQARPDWYPIPQDFIPLPSMGMRKQRVCLERTMDMNRRYESEGYVPVVHVSRVLSGYIEELAQMRNISVTPSIALGGIVPNLLRTPKAFPYEDILASLQRIKDAFPDRGIHVFGMGGTATLHLAALLGIDSVDSSGWRNRAARGLIQLPGLGDRMVIKLGSWKGRCLNTEEHERLGRCKCPACRREGISGLMAKGIHGFSNRATHNLWVLVQEAAWISKHMDRGTYWARFRARLDNSTYLRLIEKVAAQKSDNSQQAGEARRLRLNGAGRA
jgi:7-cyano-7-deazaguanine tRNA-ribosyltransferase